jgi:hypothetical protein
MTLSLSFSGLTFGVIVGLRKLRYDVSDLYFSELQADRFKALRSAPVCELPGHRL